MTVIAQSGEAIEAPAGTEENVLLTVVIPAKVMGPNGTLKVSTLWTITNADTDKTLKVIWEGTTFREVLLTENASFSDSFSVSNRNSRASQVGAPAAATELASTGAVVTASINTDIDTVLTITATKETGTDDVILERYLIEVEYGA